MDQVVEAKAPWIDLTMEKSKWHFERARKWCQRHDLKVIWAKENAQTLLKRLNLPETQIEEVIGLIVTRVPWYAEPDLPSVTKMTLRNNDVISENTLARRQPKLRGWI